MDVYRENLSAGRDSNRKKKSFFSSSVSLYHCFLGTFILRLFIFWGLKFPSMSFVLFTFSYLFLRIKEIRFFFKKNSGEFCVSLYLNNSLFFSLKQGFTTDFFSFFVFFICLVCSLKGACAWGNRSLFGIFLIAVKMLKNTSNTLFWVIWR